MLSEFKLNVGTLLRHMEPDYIYSQCPLNWLYHLPTQNVMRSHNLVPLSFGQVMQDEAGQDNENLWGTRKLSVVQRFGFALRKAWTGLWALERWLHIEWEQKNRPGSTRWQVSSIRPHSLLKQWMKNVAKPKEQVAVRNTTHVLPFLNLKPAQTKIPL